MLSVRAEERHLQKHMKSVDRFSTVNQFDDVTWAQRNSPKPIKAIPAIQGITFSLLELRMVFPEQQRGGRATVIWRQRKIWDRSSSSGATRLLEVYLESLSKLPLPRGNRS